MFQPPGVRLAPHVVQSESPRQDREARYRRGPRPPLRYASFGPTVRVTAPDREARYRRGPRPPLRYASFGPKRKWWATPGLGCG